MSKPIHTPGSAQLPTGFESVSGDEHDGMPLLSNGDPFDTIAIVVPRKECNANARLLSAAYNAFDSAARALGCNAVELAEAMQDGLLLTELLENIDAILYHTPHLNGAAFNNVATAIGKVRVGS